MKGDILEHKEVPLQIIEVDEKEYMENIRSERQVAARPCSEYKQNNCINYMRVHR